MRALESIGAQVYRLGKPADLLVRWRGTVHILEVHNPESKYRKRDPKQVEFLRDWEVAIVESAADAYRAIGASAHIAA